MGCGQQERVADSPFQAEPTLERKVELRAGNGTLHPTRLQLFDELLYIAYAGKPYIDVYTTELEPVESIALREPEGVVPTSFAVTASQLLVVDHKLGLILVYDHEGNLQNSYDRLPGDGGDFSPIAISFFDGVAYVADTRTGRALAISMTDQPGVTEAGELILTIPKSEEPSLGFPSALLVTMDGRLLVGEAESGQIRVYTCDGRSVYSFDSIPDLGKPAINAFAVDDVADPSLQDESSFDPSGVRYMGRIHVLDAANGVIHMFNPLGAYISSYPRDQRLSGPAGIAIDAETRRIYVADGPANCILVYRYVEV